jgi:uncharacterized 2Fe-2S/4Fe-4S cluster protein (DUF4445 family)
MGNLNIQFFNHDGTLHCETSAAHGELLSDVALRAGVDIGQPCGGQGRCGRCIVQVISGKIHPRSTLHLFPEDVARGYVLACQAVVQGDICATIPASEKIERRLTTDRTAIEVTVPAGYDPRSGAALRRVPLSLAPPTIDNQVDDHSRLETSLRQQCGIGELQISLALLRQIGGILRQADWDVSAILDRCTQPLQADTRLHSAPARLVTLLPGLVSPESPLWAAAVDIGTTTVSVWLVDLTSGKVVAQASDYNGQISRGEDVISRILYASRNDFQAEEMTRLVVDTINHLIDQVCAQAGIHSSEIFKSTVTGNSTMIHLLLKIPAESIRLMPFITATNRPPRITAGEIGLNLFPEAVVDFLPGVASYVGSDISAGVLASGVDRVEKLVLFLDLGTNGEIVLGCRDWLVTCACSAGPAFEGAGVECGMRAAEGAIDEVWINHATFEPDPSSAQSVHVIGDGRPCGICGSGLISLLAEMFLSGIVDKAGHIHTTMNTPRIRQGTHGVEYVVSWAKDTQDGKDIVISEVDINNLLRTKAAIYAGFSVLVERVGLSLEEVEQILIAGSFGKYINVEKAIQIGLLPDMPWERIQFLGNTSIKGAYLALLDCKTRARVDEIAAKLTYIELSADNTFYEAFMAALFLPHTEIQRFPSVTRVLGMP